MSTDFIIFGGVNPVVEEEIIVVRCMGVLITHDQTNYFFFSPLYETEEDGILSIEPGTGISIFPAASNKIEICRSMLFSSGVKINADELCMEQILGYKIEISSAPQFFIDNRGGSPKLDAKLSVSRSNVHITIEGEIARGLSVKVEK